MVAVRNEKGVVTCYEPPYTEDEELEIYRAICGDGKGFRIVHSSPRPADQPAHPQKSQPPSQEE